MQAMAQIEWFPSFAGPIPVAVTRQSNPLGIGMIALSLALAGTGLGLGYAAYRLRRDYGRLVCHDFQGLTVGVPLDFEGDWWKLRGQRLYWQARRAGATMPSELGMAILTAELGTGSPCLSQFPPHADTLPRNALFWSRLLEHVRGEMANEVVA